MKADCRSTLAPAKNARWFCTACDPEAKRTMPRQSHRVCTVDLSPEQQLVRVLARIAKRDYGDAARRDVEVISAILVEHCIPCDRWSGTCCGAFGKCEEGRADLDRALASETGRCPLRKWEGTQSRS